jgi:peptidoglycan hydrolase-like protein with peptidoglycan-binding domain
MLRRYPLVLVALLCWTLGLELSLHGMQVALAVSGGAQRPEARTPSSDFIKSLQHELKRAGYDPGIPDGKMGPTTRQALRQFQAAHGLPPTGDPDIPTLTRLLGKDLPR